jgi:DNA invertase Pin-like site-specific DNA recombinase
MLDFAALMAAAQKQHWALVALDCAVDTSTPAGEAMAHVLATFGQFERRLIGQRTKEALAAKKASGVRLGRPPTVPQSIVRRIQRLRARGLSLRAIADELNQAGVPTAQGGKCWYAATIRHVLLRTS